jgi:hypothetical protein
MGNEIKESKANELEKLTNFFADKTSEAEKAAADPKTEDAEKAAADMKEKEDAEKAFPKDLKDKKDDKDDEKDKDAEKGLLTKLVSLVEKSLALHEKNAADIVGLSERFTSHEKSLEISTNFSVQTGRFLERIDSVAGDTANTVAAIAKTTQPRATADAPIVAEKALNTAPKIQLHPLRSWLTEHYSENTPENIAIRMGAMNAAEKGNLYALNDLPIPSEVRAAMEANNA